VKGCFSQSFKKSLHSNEVYALEAYGPLTDIGVEKLGAVKPGGQKRRPSNEASCGSSG